MAEWRQLNEDAASVGGVRISRHQMTERIESPRDHRLAHAKEIGQVANGGLAEPIGNSGDNRRLPKCQIDPQTATHPTQGSSAKIISWQHVASSRHQLHSLIRKAVSLSRVGLVCGSSCIRYNIQRKRKKCIRYKSLSEVHFGGGLSRVLAPEANRAYNTPMDATTYQWPDHAQTPAHAYLLPAVLAAARESGERRLFDLGCGNGSVANRLSQEGWDVTGVDMSGQGIAQANRAFPHLKLHLGSAYDDLASKYGQFPVVLSLEVVEHLYDPRAYARTLFDLTAPGGMAIISTPYHGYWKNLALALTGKMDQHFTALWDNGHIKFWSGRTLSMLIAQPGFIVEKIVRVGRIPALAKSMVLIARRPF